MGDAMRVSKTIKMPGDAMISLTDRFGRRHHRLRISVTDRCNLRCTYCMPATGAAFVPRQTLLSFEEIHRIVSLLVHRCGFDGVRLTGGEPLVRRDLDVLVSKLRGIEGLNDLSLTTNGILLAEQVESLRGAGLDRVNISIDTLDREESKAITRRDQLDATLAGIEAAIESGIRVKLNALAIAGLTETAAGALVQFAGDHDVAIRFIEFMPLDADGRWIRDAVLSGDSLLEILKSQFGSVIQTDRAEPSAPSEEFLVGKTRVGIIRSVSKPFCQNCNRLRLTADGAIRNCLFSTHETPLRDLIRGGGSDDDVLAEFKKCVAAKEHSHGGNGDGFADATRPMYSIGG